jgi:hypothetical protein
LRDPRFVCTGRIVLPPLAPGAASHDPRLIWLWRLASTGVAPLILYEYAEYIGQRQTPTIKQRVDFILRHVVIVKTDEDRWYGGTRWRDDEHTDAIRRDPAPYGDWVRLFTCLREMNAGSRTKARAEARKLVTLFVEGYET